MLYQQGEETEKMAHNKRTYRSRLSRHGFRVKIAQTDLWIEGDKKLKPLATTVAMELRHQLELYLERHKGFAESLLPIQPLSGAPEIVKRMCIASKAANVGPMAAVAGTIAQMVGERLKLKASEGAVENGGDVFLWGEGNRKVGILSKDPSLSKELALEVKVADGLGICTSSAKIGHSLSLGEAHAVTVVSSNASLADAWATALANMIKDEGSVEKVIKLAQEIPNIKGVVAIASGKIGAWGELKLTTW